MILNWRLFFFHFFFFRFFFENRIFFWWFKDIFSKTLYMVGNDLQTNQNRLKTWKIWFLQKKKKEISENLSPAAHELDTDFKSPLATRAKFLA